MPQLLIAIAILFGAWYALKLFARTPPAVMAKYIRGAGGLSALGFGLLLLLRGAFPAAALLGAFGAFMLGLSKFPGGFGARSGTGRETVSRVRSAMIEMELDHVSGAMTGTILAGPLEGRSLDSLTRSASTEVYRQCVVDDPDGARLLEAYLDRRFPGWRQAGQGQGDAGQGGGPARRSAGAMSEDEAYEILGLRKGASREDVSRAHRTLMKKIHPDQGGSTDLAARVNEAKDILLRRYS
ncbi:MAG: DnaJ domain-containing protein [Hyphomicrobiales bacterium]|nr:DnaJ domain-containing protein [Hyphomicrobiales bacterium]